MHDIMVDLETISTQPDYGGIIQVVGVRFDVHNRRIDPTVFNRCLNLPPNVFWSEGTRQWWRNQKPETMQSIMERMEDPFTVWKEFCEFCYPSGSLRVWAKPSHFEFPFISAYCNRFDLANPFSYREAMDLNSFLRGVYFPAKVPELEIPFVGDAHDAMYDSFHQIKTLFTYLDNAGIEGIPE